MMSHPIKVGLKSIMMSHPTKVILQVLNLTVLKIQIEIQNEENMNWVKLKRPPYGRGLNMNHNSEWK